jgi:branched-chain amino acid transport system substrate-binding protein
MKFKLKAVAAAAATRLRAGGAQAQISGNVVKIGILNDQSSLYADLGGQGSVLAARMAIEDFKAKEKGLNVEVVSADHQNKADVGSQIARQWYDSDGVDVIVDVPNSGVGARREPGDEGQGQGVHQLRRRVVRPHRQGVLANTVHWTYDTWMLANGTGKAIVKTGGDSWFFITADYAFGHALERDTEAVVVKNGGKVLGKVRAPINTQDFSSFLLQAQSSKAKIVGLANAGGDTVNSIKQASEFGIVKGGQNLAGLLVFLTDVHGLGLEKAQGLIFTDDFLLRDLKRPDAAPSPSASRARTAASNPTMGPRGRVRLPVVRHYRQGGHPRLKSDDGTKGRKAKMKEIAVRRSALRKGTIRARRPQDPYRRTSSKWKKPSRGSRARTNYYKTRSTIPGRRGVPPRSIRVRLPAVKKSS